MAQNEHITAFTGDWKLNLAKSRFNPGPPFKSFTLTCTPDDPERPHSQLGPRRSVRRSFGPGPPWFGGRHGSGTQFVSWIHETDFVRAIEFLVAREEWSGVVNLAAPGPLPNGDFLRALRQAWGTRLAFPAPKWLIE